MKTLKVRIKDRNIVNIRVPDQTYKEFEVDQYFNNPDDYFYSPQFLDTIAEHVEAVKGNFFQSIEDWKEETKQEIAMYERLEIAKTRAKELL